MARITTPRIAYIPAGSVKVADKQSDAVVYLYTNSDDHMCAVAFHGKANKPDWKFRFRSEGSRADHITKFFDGRRRHKARMAERRAADNKPHTLEVGHILRSSWGYDQTNVDYYQVTKIIGKTMVELRRIGKVSSETGSLMGKCTPCLDDFKGGTFRRKVQRGMITITCGQYARLWDGTPDHWTAYA